MAIEKPVSARQTLKDAPTWYKDAIIYELHVRAFYDSVTDGIGDFAGLTQKLDYIESLGVTAIWLLPFCPSPLKDDGYDISNYTDVHPSYGTLRDFQRFLREAHRRGLRVITELVLNHTSDQHVWFQRSRRAQPGSRWRNFYVWSDTPDKYREARIIFKDFETSNWTWDPLAKAYYWHRFYSHQPDLNFDNPEVKAAMFGAMDFWFDLGVDGLRLDAVPYLFEREGTDCENLPETHTFLKELRAHVDSKYRDRMLLAEANQWPEDAAAYFGNGDECHMAFHFPLMPRLFMASRMEDRYPITDIMRLTPSIPEQCQWALFLRNHDELTLEMVTDEERDYMYRGYAHDREMRINLGIRRRLGPLLENDRRRIELMNALLFSLPGTPVVYYGDEIGMGDNIYLGDRNGVRTPMQWSSDRNAGFSRANPQRLYLPVNIDSQYHYETINVEAHQNNPHSLLWWMRRVIAQRKQFRAFGRGSLEFLSPSNRRVLAFVRQFEDETILVVANLSRFSQCAELDLSKFRGMAPVEMFGRTEFPRIRQHPYLLSLGPHAFYWFHLQPQSIYHESLIVSTEAEELPVFAIASFDNVFSHATTRAIQRIMPRLLPSRRWFLGKGRMIRNTEIIEIIPLPETSSHMLFLRVDYSDGEPEIYTLMLSVATAEKADKIVREMRQYVLARVEAEDGSRGILYGAIWDREFNDLMLGAIARRRKFKGLHGDIVAGHTRGFRREWSMARADSEASVLRADQRNSSVVFGNRLILKVFRRIEAGINPQREVQEFLTETAQFPHLPQYVGYLEYRPHDTEQEPMTLAILSKFTRSELNGWNYTIDNLSLYFERALTVQPDDARMAELAALEAPNLTEKDLGSSLMRDLTGPYLDNIRILGQRTAELHLALASHPEIPDFAPEPFTDFYRMGLYHGMIGRATRCLDQLRVRMAELSEETQRESSELLNLEEEIHCRFRILRDQRINAMRIRHHGNYRLAEVLYTGKDFVIIDFEGDPTRPMTERRIKRSPLRDVAGMIRSFHSAAHAALYGQVPGIVPSSAGFPQLQKWAQVWYRYVSATFVRAYIERAGNAQFLPQSRQQLIDLLRAYVLERALIEITRELQYRPDWVRIPIRGVLDLLGRWPAPSTRTEETEKR
ncbi:MAG: maltose alpha-D-glucosyltransferase [Terriglobales bacterium]